MDPKLARVYLIEMLGTFALVYFAAGVACINVTVTPANQPPGSGPLTILQPGLLGVALVQGLVFGLMVTLTAPISGGYLNPAIILVLWVFNRLGTQRLVWLLGAQVVGAVLAGLFLRFTFHADILTLAHHGATHLNPSAYPPPFQRTTQLAGVSVELVLTFFLVFAIFGLFAGEPRLRLAGLPAGALVAASVLVAYPLTGAALNPARWFGPVFWEYVGWTGHDTGRPNPLADALVYLAGPIIGALLGGLFCFRVYLPALAEAADEKK